MTEDEMVGWHHQLDGREFEQTPGAGDGQGSLVCCGPWSHKELGSSFQVSSVAQSCLSLCDPIDRSTPGFPVHHQLPELPQTHIH